MKPKISANSPMVWTHDIREMVPEAMERKRLSDLGRVAEARVVLLRERRRVAKQLRREGRRGTKKAQTEEAPKP